jgi:hypothetical protein
VVAARDVIDALGLVPLGFEGGYYRETGRSPIAVDAGFGPRSASTSIFYLLTPETRGLMHRLRADEVYHFYLGDPAELLVLHPDRGELIRLGQNLLGGEQVQVRIPAGSWQGSRTTGAFSLMGTTMSPGFDLEDFALGDRDALVATHPEHASLIETLTPELVKAGRLELRAATLDLLHAELRGKQPLAAGLGARVPDAWPPPLYDEAALHFSIAALSKDRRPGWMSWYVIERATRTVVGMAGFKGPPAGGLVEVGYTILPEHQRLGYATEAIGALIRWASERGASRIAAETFADLTPSIRVLEKLGFARRDPAAEPGLASSPALRCGYGPSLAPLAARLRLAIRFELVLSAD